MPKKESQVTLFIILGIVLLFTAIFLFMTTKDLKFMIGQQEQLPVRNFVQRCFEEVSKQALHDVLLQGGYYEPGSRIESMKIYKLAKPADSGGIKKNVAFSKENIERGTEAYFNETLNSCVMDFRLFSQVKEHGAFELHTEVEETVVIFRLSYPITVINNGAETKLEEFIFTEKIDIGETLDAVNQIVDKSVELNNIPKDLMIRLKDKHGLTEQNSYIIYLLEDGAKSPYDAYGEDAREFEDILYYLTIDEKYPVGFGIQYNWKGTAAPVE